jgi:putative heme transporter
MRATRGLRWMERRVPGYPMIVAAQGDGGGSNRGRLVRAGLVAWSILGVVGVLFVAYEVLTRLAVVVVPVVLAFFAAAALEPVTRWLRLLRLPQPLAALLALLAAVGLIGGVIALIVPAFRAQVPALVESLQQATGRLDEWLSHLPGPTVDLQSALTELVGGGGGGAVSAALGTTVTVGTSVVLLVVVTFFYLAEGRWLVSGTTQWLSRDRRRRTIELAERLWDTLGRYIRGLLLVALIDAVGIGLGLVLLGVPLALPLAVLVYLGAFVPVVGAFVSGMLAVLVAFAEGGPGVALAVLAVVLVVQQLEGNVLQPLVMGQVIRLPAFVILISVSLGYAWLGILGAFLAVPVAASVARIAEYLGEGDTEDDGQEGGRGGAPVPAPEP